MLNTYSNYEIQGYITHSSNLFITNIDNTSDREKIESSIELKIYDKLNKCFTFKFNEDVSQFIYCQQVINLPVTKPLLKKLNLVTQNIL